MIDMCLNINYFPFRHTFLPDSTHPLPRFDTPFSRFRTPFSHYDTPEIATKPVNKGFAAKGISLDLFG